MIDFDIQRCTRRCHATDRELAPGEAFYSVLVSEGSDVVRRDYSVAAWQGPPADTLGWWKSRVPEPSARKAQLAPSEVLVSFFEELGDAADQADLRYLLALLMVRRKLLRQEDLETDDEGRTWLVVFCPRTETEHRVLEALPTAERAAAIQEQLARLLYADAT